MHKSNINERIHASGIVTVDFDNLETNTVEIINKAIKHGTLNALEYSGEIKIGNQIAIINKCIPITKE